MRLLVESAHGLPRCKRSRRLVAWQVTHHERVPMMGRLPLPYPGATHGETRGQSATGKRHVHLTEEVSDAVTAVRSTHGLARLHAKALLHASRQRALDVADGQGCKCA